MKKSLIAFAALILSGPAGIALRLTVMDRARRRLRSAFSLYLPKSEVDKLVREERPPTLGGELREVTILFSDIASYSTLSERVEPGPLVDDLNHYFSRMTEIVQAHGGFVDKFIGDGILAIFGAPLSRPNAALDAVQASLAMIESLQKQPLFIGGLPIPIEDLSQPVGDAHADRLIGGCGECAAVQRARAGASVANRWPRSTQ